MATALSICTAALLLVLLVCTNAQDKESIPERCNQQKPKAGDCPEITEKERKYFFHSTKGCKPSGFCPDDVVIYDGTDSANYFDSKEACIEACLSHPDFECPQLKAIANGTVSNDGRGYWGTSVHYTCSEEFYLKGNDKRECEQDGSWTGSDPECKPKCPTPDVSGVSGVSVTPLLTHYNPGDIVALICIGDFVGSAKRTCRADGTWSQEEIVCERKKESCERPAVINNSKAEALNGLTVGSVVTYTCDEGFSMHGNSTRECLEDLTWSGEDPICWKLTIEEYQCNSISTAAITDITHQIYTVMNLAEHCFRVKISNPNPFDTEPTWNGDFEGLSKNIEYELENNELKIPKALHSKFNNRVFTATVNGYRVNFTLKVTEPPTTPPPPTPQTKKPETVFWTKKVTKSPGEEAMLRCIFDACPSSQIDWMHENAAINTTTSRINISSQVVDSRYTFSTLNIGKLGDSDFGPYECVGYNPGGSITQINMVVKKEQDSKREASGCINSPETVTLVGRVRRQPLEVNSNFAKYKVRVQHIISQSSTNPLSKAKRSLRTFVFSEHKKLDKGVYIFQGAVRENYLFTENVVEYSIDAEKSLRQC